MDYGTMAAGADTSVRPYRRGDWAEERRWVKGAKAGWKAGRRPGGLPHIRMPAPQEEAGPQRGLAPQSGATRGRSHPPPRLAAWHARLRAPREHLVWHARLRAPRRGRCGKPGGMLNGGRLRLGGNGGRWAKGAKAGWKAGRRLESLSHKSGVSHKGRHAPMWAECEGRGWRRAGGRRHWQEEGRKEGWGLL